MVEDDGLGDEAGKGKHREAPVVQLGRLVAAPAQVVSIHVLAGAKQVTRLVVGALREDEREDLDGGDEGLRGGTKSHDEFDRW